jgi:hypothetical protein
MTDPAWTPDDALRILTDALDAYAAGTMTPTQLHLWLTGTYATPPDTPADHPATFLWK